MRMTAKEYQQYIKRPSSRIRAIDDDNPTEYCECVDLTYKLNELMDEGKILQYTHISNETFTKSWNVKRRNKAQGVRCGVPDYLLITPDKIIFIEMKRKKGGCVSPEQKQWIAAIQQAGGYATVTKGAEQAIEYLEGLL